MRFLDSNVLIEILNRNSERGKQAVKRLEQSRDPDILMSSLVFEEVQFGILKYQQIDSLPEFHLLNQFPVVDFTKQDAITAARIENQMEEIGKKKPRGDVLIAATVISNGGTLFTYNTKHYENIDQLSLLSQ